MAQLRAAIEQLLTSRGAIRTRLREASDGLVHDLPLGSLETSGASGSGAEFIAVLEELERSGVVSRRETVHPYDSSEYVVTWFLNQAGEARQGTAGDPGRVPGGP